MRISDWSSDVCSSDLALELAGAASPSLDAAAAELRAADAGRQIAGLRPNPSLAIDAANVAGSGPSTALGGAEGNAPTELPHDLGGTRSPRIDVADATARTTGTPDRPEKRRVGKK